MHSQSTPSREEKFWSYVDSSDTDGCWPWVGSRTGHNYGSFRYDNHYYSAHRLAWELTNGPIPPGLVIRHLVCDNPPCCNPAHLEVGTQKQNREDAMARGRFAMGDRSGLRLHPESRSCGEKNGAYTHPETRARGDRNGSRLYPERLPRGENHPRARLSDQQIGEMRRLYDAGECTQKQLRILYDVNKEYVSRIVRRTMRTTGTERPRPNKDERTMLSDFIAFLEKKGVGGYTPERNEPVRFCDFAPGSLEEEFLTSRPR